MRCFEFRGEIGGADGPVYYSLQAPITWIGACVEGIYRTLPTPVQMFGLRSRVGQGRGVIR